MSCHEFMQQITSLGRDGLHAYASPRSLSFPFMDSLKQRMHKHQVRSHSDGGKLSGLKGKIKNIVRCFGNGPSNPLNGRENLHTMTQKNLQLAWSCLYHPIDLLQPSISSVAIKERINAACVHSFPDILQSREWIVAHLA